MLCAFINRECDGDCVAFDPEMVGGCTRINDKRAFYEELIESINRLKDEIHDIAPQ